MDDEPTPTRRAVLRSGAAIGAVAAGVTLSGTAAAGAGNDKGKQFGRVYANDDLWRTNVVKELDDRPDPEDKLYFLHDGEQPIVANSDASGDQLSPFVSETAPGDQDWNGGKWVTFSAEVTNVTAFNADAPLTNDTDVLNADYITVSLGNPGFGPPNYFICPLNGRA